ncbi:MFS transporter [Polaromonas sp. JS666]|uniref:MFS transporter n=1 Tax=Polaromonas sp. (strain JS666 / ATCC BAA-500) TaxID=296591 RepID=UPI00059D0A2E|nr:MFS transporter [Polaromonas sp. JS666]
MTIQQSVALNDMAVMPALPRRTLLLFALTSGLSVANIYYSQPLIENIARDLGMSPVFAGVVVTVTQFGYAIGLLFLVPLAELINHRRLIVGQLLLSALALVAVGIASSVTVLLLGFAMIGLLAVVIQILVALAAAVSSPSEQGRAVGAVTSGVALGVIAARSIAGPLAALTSWRTVFVVSAALTSLAAYAMANSLPRRSTLGKTRSYWTLLRSVVTLLLEERLLHVRAGLALLVFAAFGVLWSSLALELSAAPLSLSQAAIGLFGFAGVAGVAGAASAGLLADRGWGQWTTGIALTLMFLAWWPLSRNQLPLWTLIVGVGALDMGGQAVHVASQSLLFRALPQARNRILAAYMLFYSVGTGVGALASTAAFAWSGWRGVCQLGAAISATALLFWAATLRESRRNRVVSPG